MILRHATVFLPRFLLITLEDHAEDFVAGTQTFGVWPDMRDGAGEATSYDLGWGDEQVAVVLVEIQWSGAGPFVAHEDFAWSRGGRGNMMEFEFGTGCYGDDGAVCGHLNRITMRSSRTVLCEAHYLAFVIVYLDAWMFYIRVGSI